MSFNYMMDIVKNIFRRRNLGTHDTSSAAKHNSIDISPDVEVNLIKTLLERKFNRKFQMRVKVEGYLGEEMKYRLVVDDYCANNPQHKYHSVYGYGTNNILDVKREFLESYWDQLHKVHASVGKTLDKWDTDMIADYKDTMVASSREEMLIQAELEGSI